MEDDQQLAGEMIANTVDISVGSAYNILFEELFLIFFSLGIKTFVPRPATDKSGILMII